MAKIKAPPFFTERKRAKGSSYVWQPPSRLAKAGWKAKPLTLQDDTPSDVTVAMQQAQWLNAIFNQVRSARADVAAIIQDTWAHGQSGKAWGLSPCPFVPYEVPGLEAQKRSAPAREKSIQHLVQSYRQSPGYHDVAPRTRQDYDRILNDLTEMLGTQKTTSMRRARLHEIYQTLLKVHRRHSANARMRVLSVILSHAVTLEWLDANPCLQFKLLPVEGRIVVPTGEEIAALLQAALTMPGGPRHDAVLLIMAAADTGQRRGDLVESILLKDYRAGRLTFAQQKRGAFINLTIVETFRMAAEALVQHLEGLGIAMDQRFAELKLQNPKAWFRHLKETPLLWSLDTLMPMDRFSATHLFIAVRRRAALTLPSVGRLRLSDFRDYMVTELFRASCTDAEVASITGHSEKSIGMKRKHYVERHDPMIQNNAMGKLLAWRNRSTA